MTKIFLDSGHHPDNTCPNRKIGCQPSNTKCLLFTAFRWSPDSNLTYSMTTVGILGFAYKENRLDATWGKATRLNLRTAPCAAKVGHVVLFEPFGKWLAKVPLMLHYGMHSGVLEEKNKFWVQVWRCIVAQLESHRTTIRTENLIIPYELQGSVGQSFLTDFTHPFKCNVPLLRSFISLK